LGIVAVRFNTYFRINSDSVKFRIKEQGSSKWYYENVYKVDQFQPNDYFTFGLPIISNSKGKTYDFEIESVKGVKYDAVAISKIQPIFITKYQYPKTLLLSNPKIFLVFIFQKALYFLTSPQLILSTLIFALPLFVYLFWVLLLYRYLPFQYLLAFLFIIAFFAYIFYSNNFSSSVSLYVI